MAKIPFAFHVVPAEWGKHLPAGDYTVGRGADPRSNEERSLEPGNTVGKPATGDDPRADTGEAHNRRASAAE